MAKKKKKKRTDLHSYSTHIRSILSLKRGKYIFLSLKLDEQGAYNTICITESGRIYKVEKKCEIVPKIKELFWSVPQDEQTPHLAPLCHCKKQTGSKSCGYKCFAMINGLRNNFQSIFMTYCYVLAKMRYLRLFF